MSFALTPVRFFRFIVVAQLAIFFKYLHSRIRDNILCVSRTLRCKLFNVNSSAFSAIIFCRLYAFVPVNRYVLVDDSIETLIGKLAFLQEMASYKNPDIF